MKTSTLSLGALVAAAALAGGWLAAAQSRPRAAFGSGEELVKGLLATPGCLGVETALASSGKNVVFAWFTGREAALEWYYSETHQGAMEMLLTDNYGSEPHEPLAHVPEDCGPILCIASLTPNDRGVVPGINLPIKQIAIELYTPLPAGIAIGGRFSPEKLQVPHLVDIELPGMSAEAAEK